MLDKVTKACYNFLSLFCFCSFYMLLLLKIKILKGFYQATLKKGWLNQLFKTNSFNTASH
ncbi:hypothetical protein EDC85_03400 [Helicobacter pylori]|nr:hypothetical protein EC557_03120 [Helicobacter pylori]RVZ91886.1 hypothetical protein EDC85_03400 [Helicobacter pylori]